MSGTSDILAIGLSPAIQKSVLFPSFTLHEVNRSTEYYTDAAGKCINVSRVLVQSGVSADCLTNVGTDNAEEFKALCERDGIVLTAVPTGKKVRTCTTIIETDTGDCTELVVNEPEVVTEEEEAAFKAAFLEKITQGYKAIIISGSKFKGYSDEIIPFMVGEAKQRGVTTIVDFKGLDLINSFISDEIRPDYVKINGEEFLETFEEYDELEDGLKAASTKYGNAFVISRGAQSTLISENGELAEIPSERLKPVNPIGCGDSMTAGLAGGIIGGKSLYEAVQLGIAHAAKNVMSIHPGWIID